MIHFLAFRRLRTPLLKFARILAALCCKMVGLSTRGACFSVCSCLLPQYLHSGCAWQIFWTFTIFFWCLRLLGILVDREMEGYCELREPPCQLTSNKRGYSKAASFVSQLGDLFIGISYLWPLSQSLKRFSQRISSF